MNYGRFLPLQATQYTSFFGISLNLLPALLHTVLGYFSLGYAFKTPREVSSFLVSTSEKEKEKEH